MKRPRTDPARGIDAGAAAAVVLAAYGAALVLLLWQYPTDVVAGWCVAVAWVTGSWVMLGAPVVSDPAARMGFSRSAEGE